MKPLDGVRVLDLSRILAGPFASMMLADYGAEVIKVENPDGGDDTRAWGPPFVNAESAYFLSANRNKKSITLNLKSPRAKEVMSRLVAKSDVLLENFRPGTLDKLGWGYEAIRKANPRMIYCAISGFGRTGPLADRGGYDLAAQGIGGLMSLTGSADGPPTKVGTSIADLLAGIYAVQGILLALYAREKTGKGQLVDVALVDGIVSVLSYQAGIHFANGSVPKRRGNEHPTICPYETFKASDDFINIAVGNDALWQKFCEVTGLRRLAKDPSFVANENRVRNRPQLVPLIQQVIGTKPARHWLDLLDKSGIPAGPILTLDKTLTHPQVLARKMVVEADHPKAGRIKMTGVPVKLSDTPGGLTSPPPLLGQHTDEVLTQVLGFSLAESADLRQSGAL